ncbi:hypothetical protein C1645_760827 [Glomus cerebriforme]|uniref:Uncharacterized protein n=1 Tax=Glomus cerebriforme TaxID=658196 RepID=A0A397TGK5_9GLOM|nr:hypothetical protein C1645_760827 [Glomus cerebriforme]
MKSLMSLLNNLQKIFKKTLLLLIILLNIFINNSLVFGTIDIQGEHDTQPIPNYHDCVDCDYNDNNDNDGGLGTGAIIGIAAAVVIVLLLIIALCKRR